MTTGHAGHAHVNLMEIAKCAADRAGEQWTPMRAAVLRALDGKGKPTSAYDLAEVVSQHLGRRVAANTVYRILDLLVDWELVRRIESLNAYAICAHQDHQHDCVFLLCETCGKVEEVEADQVTADLRAVAGRRAFRTSRLVMELSGTCADCAATQSSSDSTAPGL
jgi:Fur family transcriptional regulator, zinc uptake regulator